MNLMIASLCLINYQLELMIISNVCMIANKLHVGMCIAVNVVLLAKSQKKSRALGQINHSYAKMGYFIHFSDFE